MQVMLLLDRNILLLQEHCSCRSVWADVSLFDNQGCSDSQQHGFGWARGYDQIWRAHNSFGHTGLLNFISLTHEQLEMPAKQKYTLYNSASCQRMVAADMEP